MNILQISPQFPFPPDDGGRISIANITKEFARRGANVTLFYLGEKPAAESLAEAKRFADVVHCPHSTRNSLLRIAVSAVLPVPLYIWKHTGADITQALQRLLRQKKFDVIHADHSAMMPAALYAQSIQRIPVGLRLHNVEWLIWQRYAGRITNPLKRLYIARQARLVRRAEAEFYPKADVCFAITEDNLREAQLLAPSAYITMATIGVQPDEWQPEAAERMPAEAILATTYKWVHNVEGVNWLAEQVMPRVREALPDATLRLIGKEPPAHFGAWEHIGVQVEGYVERVQPYLSRAGIYVAPLFVGSGVRIKIIEAMAMELPVVATSVAAEGIPAGEEQGLFRADTPEEFARAMTALMSDPARARTVGSAARRYVSEHFTWSAAVGKMLEEYDQILSEIRI
jgi:glycosyltransferase involved in cell wall biosynthesis